MRESDLKILESLLTAITEGDEDIVEEIRIMEPQKKMTEVIISYLDNRIHKLESLGEHEKAEEYKRILSRVRHGRE